MTVESKIHSSTPTASQAAATTVSVEVTKQLSGPSWCSQFPGSRNIADLEQPFKSDFTAFHTAMVDAGATVTISATYRPPERAYLMHYCYRIANEGLDVKKVSRMNGVNIEWDHGDKDASRKAAGEMVKGFQMEELKTRPSLTSRHTEGFAVDMNITWKEKLTINQKDGTSKEITSNPTNRMNTELHKVGKDYGVIKYYILNDDKPHWSSDGR